VRTGQEKKNQRRTDHQKKRNPHRSLAQGSGVQLGQKKGKKNKTSIVIFPDLEKKEMGKVQTNPIRRSKESQRTTTRRRGRVPRRKGGVKKGFGRVGTREMGLGTVQRRTASKLREVKTNQKYHLSPEREGSSGGEEKRCRSNWGRLQHKGGSWRGAALCLGDGRGRGLFPCTEG